MLEEIKKKSIIDYWRKHVEPCRDMNDEEIFDSFINYAINQEFESIIKWEVENGKKV